MRDPVRILVKKNELTLEGIRLRTHWCAILHWDRQIWRKLNIDEIRMEIIMIEIQIFSVNYNIVIESVQWVNSSYFKSTGNNNWAN
jgi:hypothetical protein